MEKPQKTGLLTELAKGFPAAVKDARHDLKPTFAAGLQDAQFLLTRMTLDQAPQASVLGQPGVPTPGEADREVQAGNAYDDFLEKLKERYRSRKQEPDKGMEL